MTDCMVAHLVRTLPVPETFLEIGVGVQDSASVQLNEHWDGVQFVGFEPDPQRFRTCQCDYPGSLFCSAVWNEPATVTLYRSPENRLFGLFCDWDCDSVQVPATTLDSIFADGRYGRSVIWADIEGSELMMLRGGRTTLQSGVVSGLVLEVRDEVPASGWCTRQEVVSFLAAYDYHAAVSVPRGRRHQDVLFVRGR